VSLGYRTGQARNGREALDAIEQELPLAVLLDLRKPVMSGWGLLDALEKMPSLQRVPFIVISAYGFEWEAELVGATGYIGKPVELDAVEQVLRRSAIPAGHPEGPYATGGQQVTVGATAAAQWREYFLREQVRGSWTRMGLRAGDRVFQVPNVNVVMPNGGWAVFNDLDAGWTDGRLTLPIGWNCQKALFGSADHLPGERATAAQGFRHPVGPSVNGAWAQPRGSRLVPSVFLQVQRWLAHPYRTGKDVPQSVPWVLAAFAVSGDIL